METANRDIAIPAVAAAMGCSTTTTEVVVPSSELDLKSSHGQWRYLEADSTPVHGDDAVEVTKGVRFTTSLESLDRREDEVCFLFSFCRFCEEWCGIVELRCLRLG